MKTTSHLLAFGLMLLGMSHTATAQIRNNESSVTVLAVQCAVSSGFAAQDYEDYCRSLAKTLGMLSGAQQTRIFGYLPQPSGAGSLETETPASTTPTRETEATNETASENAIGSATGATNETPSATTTGITKNEPGLLVGLIRELNNTIDGTVSTAAPVVASVSGVQLDKVINPGTLNTLARTSENSGTSKSGSSGTSLLNWVLSLLK